ncbi:MAG: hypothetical protein ABEK03_05560 [Candidatus Bipolaricaulia bacterium]
MRSTVLIATVTLIIFAMLIMTSAQMSQPSSRTVDFATLINDRIDNLTALLQEELPEASSNLIPFWEQARSGISSGSLQPIVQSVIVTNTIQFTLQRSGRLSRLGDERLQQALALVADAVILGFPDAELPLLVGRYIGPDGNEEAVLGPFLNTCPDDFRIQGVGDFQLDDCVPARSAEE